MPRVLNVALGGFLLLVAAPIVTHLGDKPGYVQVALVLCVLPILLVAGLCLASAARPGSLGRSLRRLRARRTSR